MDEAFTGVENVEDLFKELDESKFSEIAATLSAYRNELMKNGFTRRETMRLVEAHSKFVYDMAIESYIADRNEAIDDGSVYSLPDEDQDVDDEFPEQYS